MQLGPGNGEFWVTERSAQAAEDLLRRRIADYYRGYEFRPFEVWVEMQGDDWWTAIAEVVRVPDSDGIGAWL